MLLGPVTLDKASDEFNEELNCRKALMQGKILISRGIYDTGISLIKKTSKLAEKYEFPDLKLAAFDILRKYDKTTSGPSRSKYYSQQMDSAFNMFGKILRAKEINYQVTNVDNSIPSLQIRLSKVHWKN